MLLRSLQRSGRLIARTVLPGVSAGLREAIADLASGGIRQDCIDESSRAPSQHIGVDRTVTRTVP